MQEIQNAINDENQKYAHKLEQLEEQVNSISLDSSLENKLISSYASLFSLIDSIDGIAQQINRKSVDNNLLKNLLKKDSDISKSENLRLRNNKLLYEECQFKIKQLKSVKQILMIKLGDLESNKLRNINFF